MGQRSYTAEYRANAVELAQEIGASTAARQQKNPVDTLYTWITQAKNGNLPMATTPPDPMASLNSAEQCKELERKNKTLRSKKRSYSKRIRSWRKRQLFRRAPEEVGKRWRFEYIHTHAERQDIALYCRMLGVTPQGYAKYAQGLTRPQKYAGLLASKREILEEDIFNKTYGKRRMYEKLRLDPDYPYSYNAVAKVMRERGLLHKPNDLKGLTKADKEAQKSDNLLNRDFSADAPNERTVTNITEWTACDGKIYQSSIFDCYDNMCLAIPGGRYAHGALR